MENVIVWAQENLPLILAVAFAVSEALGMIPSFKSNGVFDFIFKALKKGTELFPKKK